MLIHTVIAITVSRLLAQSGNGAMSALSPHSGVKRKLDLGAVRSASDPARVETFFVSQKLHTTGRDEPRRDRLSLFLLYRVWNQEGRNLGATLTR